MDNENTDARVAEFKVQLRSVLGPVRDHLRAALRGNLVRDGNPDADLRQKFNDFLKETDLLFDSSTITDFGVRLSHVQTLLRRVREDRDVQDFFFESDLREYLARPQRGDSN